MSDAETIGYASDISDVETIQYAKSYRDRASLNNQYRLKSKKKAIKTLRKERTEPDLKITKVVKPPSPEFVNIFNSLDDKKLFDKKDYFIPIKAEYVRKSYDIHRSTHFSFQGPFELLHADLDNLLENF